ncbi:hypothetical protein [Sorangium sp. So ce1078]|uniref:hypothetical protein n=1 Tax=Sorangium sp. So ce1078 TaxID=3133329 RepID=UPI003F62E9CE
MPSFMTGKGKPGARIVSRKTRDGMPVTASTFFCESISGYGAVIVSPSSVIASVAVAKGLIVLGSCDPPTGRARNILSVARMPLSA